MAESLSTNALDAGDKPELPADLLLVVTSGPDAGKRLVLKRGSYLVGKASGCDLVLVDEGVSRRHLKLKVLRDGISVRDLDSKNGSFFQGAAFKEVRLLPGATVKIGGATELRLTAAERQARPLSTATRFGRLVGRSPAMREVFAVLERAAPSNAAVLIEGETGTGKDLCAEALHAASARADGPFVVCDLAGITRSLLESELFGHVRGAFTGADRDHEGLFVRAHHGTVFLDEIGELPLDLQPRLLRVLEQQRVRPIGATAYRAVNVRILAATNRDLTEEVRAGRFRGDLFHRLAVVRVAMPPLRARKEDLPLLLEALLMNEQVEVSQEALSLLGAYDWPGNVRELSNALARARSLSPGSGKIEPHQLGLVAPAPGTESLPNEDFHRAKAELIDRWERGYLSELLEGAGGNVALAARRGGLDRPYLHRLLRKHGLSG
jgi:DNA-binding NtrC family response regulator